MLPVSFPVILLLTGSCHQKTELPLQKQAVKVRVETVDKTNTRDAFSYVGVIEENSSVALSFSSIGTIERIYVNDGQHVNKGQLLATLNSTSARNMLEAAESAFKQAQDGYKRLKMIHDNSSLPEIQMVEIETKLQQAQSALNIARKNMEDCSLIAPVSGIIGKRRAEAGENAVIGNAVLTILDIRSVKVRFSVPENEISSIPAEGEITVRVAALGDREFTAKTIEKSVQANAVSHSYPAFTLLANPRKELLPGMVCKVEISSGVQSGIIVVPLSLIRVAADGRKFIWTVEGDTAAKVYVTTGEARGNGVEILNGLRAGMQIITEGYQKVSEGDKIVRS